MVSCFNIKAHLFQCQDDVTPAVFTPVSRFHVKVVFLVVNLSGWVTIFIKLEKEEFWFWSNVEVLEAQGPHILQDPLQVVPGITGEWRTIRVVNTADDPGHLTVFRSPWEGQPGGHIWIQVHVTLFDPDKAID